MKGGSLMEKITKINKIQKAFDESKAFCVLSYRKF